MKKKEYNNSVNKLYDLRNDFKETINKLPFNHDVCVFAAGSLGRMEITHNSDLDLFFIIIDKSEKKKKLFRHLIIFIHICFLAKFMIYI